MAYFLGALVVMAALGWLLNESWLSLGSWGVAAIAAAYGLGFWFLGDRLHRRGLRVPGGLLLTLAAWTVPLAIWGIEHALGLWHEDPLTRYRSYYQWIRSGWLPLELGCIAASALLFARYRFPTLLFTLCFSLWYLSMDLTPLLFGEPFDWRDRARVSLVCGLLYLLAATLVDRRTERDHAFWLYLFGTLSFWGGLSLLDSGSEWGRLAYGTINLGMVFLSVPLQRGVLAVFGLLGFFGYLGHLAFRVFRDSLLFPFVLTALGLSLIASGLLYRRFRPRLEAILSDRLPEALRRLLPRHRGGRT
ncbi:DUF2157 domain-containing protein [Aminomonas paucivorans]|uniref:DUF2157 domain-containing protein n=1 Tax=Aminomonas paucivorans TaxID=81412 RepID=UPI00030CC3CD|nr:DUF2157 domain-containing protein [Aminomonas paucivorans]